VIFELGDHRVVAEGEYYVAQGAVVLGSVILKDRASVWFGAILRGDNEPITIGEGSNVQDGAIIHTDPGFPCTLGANVTIGHQAILHGCTIGDGSLIGIGAVVLNGARIGSNCVIGARALVTEGKQIPDNSMVLGAPGKVVRALTDDEARAFAMGARHYVENGRRFRRELRPQSEADRP
jgi:carbonic anhydrase/acetyltransferase-like protein (isoleucine patch superfamily)